MRGPGATLAAKRRQRNGDNGAERPGTFDLLGFTHYWSRSRNGWWVVKRKTARDRFSRALNKVAQWCRRYRHQPIAQQWKGLSQKLRGHFRYYGIIGNAEAIGRFRFEVRCTWRKWLSRRSQQGHMTRVRMEKLMERFPLPPARVVRHFTPRSEPVS